MMELCPRYKRGHVPVGESCVTLETIFDFFVRNKGNFVRNNGNFVRNNGFIFTK